MIRGEVICRLMIPRSVHYCCQFRPYHSVVAVTLMPIEDRLYFDYLRVISPQNTCYTSGIALRKVLTILIVCFGVSGCEDSSFDPINSIDPSAQDLCDVPLATDLVPNDLEVYLPLDGDLKDYSGNCRHAEQQGAPVFVSGFQNQSIQFDGEDDLLLISASKSPYPMPRFTFTFLIKLEEPILSEWEHSRIFSTEDWNIDYFWACNSRGCFPSYGYRGYQGRGTSSRDHETFRSWVLLVIRSPGCSGSGWLSVRFQSFLSESQEIDGIDCRDSATSSNFGGRSILFGGQAMDDQKPLMLRARIDEIRIYSRTLTKFEQGELFTHYKSIQPK